jgi:hypothetical protein
VTDDVKPEEQVAQILDADSPPLGPLGSTTDYRQVLTAWAVRHGLSLDETLQRLEAQQDPMGASWAAKIRADPATEAALRASLDAPLQHVDDAAAPETAD